MAKKIFKDLFTRQVKVTKICSYIIFVFYSLVLLIAYFGYDVKHILITLSGIYVGAILVNILLCELHRKVYLAYQILIIISFLEIVTIINYTGGIISPAIFILTVLPVAAFSTSRKQGILWSVVAIVTIMVFFTKSESSGAINVIMEESRYLFSLAVVLFTLALSIIISYMVNRSTFDVHRAFDRDSRALREKSKRIENLTTLLNYSADLMCIVDLKTLSINDLNPTFKIILGYELSEVRDRNFLEFMKKDKNTSSLDSSIMNLREDEVMDFECIMVCKNGVEKAYKWTGISKNGKFHAIARSISAAEQISSAM